MNRKTKLNYIGAETERIGSEGRAPPVRHRLKPQTVHIYESHTEGGCGSMCNRHNIYSISKGMVCE